MHTLIHRIRLRDGVDPARFEAWVREVDYRSCPQLPSVRAFSIHRVAAQEGEYFEVIDIESHEAFERDMRSAAFRRLEAGFGELAAVVDDLAGERLEPGYRA
jgi:REDY-like protein HapK